MPQFVIKVADEQGHLREQVEHGHSEADVHDRFTQQGYLVYWVKPRTLLSGRKGQLGKLRHGTFLIFNQQFLTLIKAGLPILMGLDLLRKRQRNPFFRSLLENVRERVKGGELLSEAFEAQGHGRREERQHGGSPEPLHLLSAHGADFPEEIAGVAGLSHAAGNGSHLHADFLDHLRSAEVRRPVQ